LFIEPESSAELAMIRHLVENAKFGRADLEISPDVSTGEIGVGKVGGHAGNEQSVAGI
jgi:hypothetical protein